MPTYSNISYATTTATDSTHGRGLDAGETGIYADNQFYLADGSVYMRPVNDWLTYQILCNNTVILCRDKWQVLANGCLPYSNIGYA
uniref:Uncharacterized protein n=1 Tax=viral metagenome TaxID=1070528 RepID=A0A6M3Y0X1_9ZZZZ